MNRFVRTFFLPAVALAAAVVLWPADAHAQRARPRTSPPRVVRTYVVRPVYYSRYSYNPFFWGSWGPYGWYPSSYYGYGYYGQYPRYPYRYYYSDEASLRVQIEPKRAQVYVDGYYVGEVDAFDGIFQRLHLPPGNHTIEVYLEGFRTIRENMRFEPREGYQLKRTMEPLAPGEPPAARPTPDPNAPKPQWEDPYFDRRDDRRDPREQRAATDSGAVAICVQPAGATILIDGEKWESPEGPDRLVVHLSEGSHRVEIQKEGYRPFITEVRVRRGETVPLNVSLRAR